MVVIYRFYLFCQVYVQPTKACSEVGSVRILILRGERFCDVSWCFLERREESIAVWIWLQEDTGGHQAQRLRGEYFKYQSVISFSTCCGYW